MLEKLLIAALILRLLSCVPRHRDVAVKKSVNQMEQLE